MAITQSNCYLTAKPNIPKFSSEDGLHFLGRSFWLKPPQSGQQARSLSKTRSKNSEFFQRLAYNFLLKRKLSLRT
jgi:hypothetical protein